MNVLEAGPGDRKKLLDLGWTTTEVNLALGVEDDEEEEVVVATQVPSAPVQSGGQMRMAEIFVFENSPYLRYVHDLGWYLWTGCYWKADDERADIRAATATIRNTLAKLPDMLKEERDSLFADVRKVESANGMEGMLKIAGATRPLSTAAAQLDADPHLFNTANGTINLLTGVVSEPSRKDMITKSSGGVIEDGSNSGEWMKFLERVLPDAEVRSYVQRLMGYAMLGKVTDQIMPIFTGTGANGKSVFMAAMAAAFGDYAIEADAALLMESKHERHGTFKMRLRGARLVSCSETEQNRKFSEATVKKLTDGTPIEANLMRRDPIEFEPSHLLVMLTNHLPVVSGDDPAVWRRLSVVPWDVVIPVAERDPLLSEKLRNEKSAVLSWAYQGWLDYQQQGLNPPAAVLRRTQEYQHDSDVMSRFLEDMTVSSGVGMVKARKMFETWSRWCMATGEEVGTEKSFAKAMENRSFAKKKKSGGQFYVGVALLVEESDE